MTHGNSKIFCGSEILAIAQLFGNLTEFVYRLRDPNGEHYKTDNPVYTTWTYYNTSYPKMLSKSKVYKVVLESRSFHVLWLSVWGKTRFSFHSERDKEAAVVHGHFRRTWSNSPPGGEFTLKWSREIPLTFRTLKTPFVVDTHFESVSARESMQ